MSLEKITDRFLSNIVIYTYLETVIYKYIPGNIFHFAGRHTLEKKLSLKRNEIIITNAIEVVMQILSALLLTLLLYKFVNLDFLIAEYIDKKYFKYSILVIIITSIFLIFYLYKKYFKKKLFLNYIYFIFKLLVNYSFYLIFSGFVLILMLYLFYDYYILKDSLFIILYVNIVAWIIGYITPGAPGGIGVRESIILIPLITLGLDSDIVLLSVMLQRIIMIFSELIIFICIKLYNTSKIKKQEYLS